MLTFGVAVSLWSFLYKYKDKFGPLKSIVVNNKHKAIERALSKNIAFDFSAYSENIISNKIIKNSPAWVCWWDGEEMMPPTVQLCYQSILRRANCQSVKLITKDNFQEYITVPKVIKIKFDQGMIPIQQFIDVVRVLLLKKYGGLWLDATIYLSDDLNMELNRSFFSLKHNKESDFVSNGQWSVFLIGATADHPLFNFLSNAFLQYFEKYDFLIDYFLMDYLISIACNNINEINKDISDVSVNNTNTYFIQKHINQTFIQNEYSEKTKDTVIHKLNWREPIIPSGSGTSYFEHLSKKIKVCDPLDKKKERNS